jgi:ribosomal protein S18 acetylase RimI-like enzyme
MAVPITQASVERVPELAGLLGRAFYGDPLFRWPMKEEANEDAIAEYFDAFDRRLAKLGWLWEAGDALGVAAWIPPGGEDAVMDIDRDLRPLVARATDDGGARYEVLWEWIGESLPDEPFWYLEHLAVDRKHRNAGVGSALIAHGVAFADRDGVPAVLETSRPANVSYYERRGFRTTVDADVPGGGPHIWFMRYDPP